MTDQLDSQLKKLRNELYLCIPLFVDDAVLGMDHVAPYG